MPIPPPRPRKDSRHSARLESETPPRSTYSLVNAERIQARARGVPSSPDLDIEGRVRCLEVELSGVSGQLTQVLSAVTVLEARVWEAVLELAGDRSSALDIVQAMRSGSPRKETPDKPSSPPPATRKRWRDTGILLGSLLMGVLITLSSMLPQQCSSPVAPVKERSSEPHPPR